MDFLDLLRAVFALAFTLGIIGLVANIIAITILAERFMP